MGLSVLCHLREYVKIEGGGGHGRAVPSAAACYRDEDHLDGFVCLELVDGFVAVVAGLFAIDTSERDGGVFE